MDQIDIVCNDKERLSVWYDVLLITVVLFVLQTSSSEDTGVRTTAATQEPTFIWFMPAQYQSVGNVGNS